MGRLFDWFSPADCASAVLNVRAARTHDCDRAQSRDTAEVELHWLAFQKTLQKLEAGWRDLPQNDLLRTDENAGAQKLVVSRIVKVCKASQRV